MSRTRQGLWLLAAPCALAVGACDSGYKAGYYDGFSLGYETKGSEQPGLEKARGEAERLAAADAVPLVLTTPEPTQVAAIVSPKAPSIKPVRTLQKTAVQKPAARPAAALRTPAATQAEPAPAETTAATPSPAAPSPKAKPQPAIAPFAPLRPGPSGGGVIIRVGNNTVTPDDGGKPDDGGAKPDDGTPGNGDTGAGDSGGKDPVPPPVIAPQAPATQVAKITVVDTNLVGAAGASQLIGVGVASVSPTQALLVSANVLPADGRSIASVDSLVAVSVGKTPIVSGGSAPLVSVSALPDLSGVTQIVSPVTGALAGSGGTATASSGGGAAASPAPIPVVPVVTSVVADVGSAATSLVGGLLGGGRAKH